MKKLILVFVAILSLSTSFANNEKPVNKTKTELRTKIVKLLGKADFSFDKEISTTVSFLINTKGEIIVVSVNTENTKVDSYIKRKLNYKKVEVKTTRASKVYKMPLRIVKN